MASRHAAGNSLTDRVRVRNVMYPYDGHNAKLAAQVTSAAVQIEAARRRMNRLLVLTWLACGVAVGAALAALTIWVAIRF